MTQLDRNIELVKMRHKTNHVLHIIFTILFLPYAIIYLIIHSGNQKKMNAEIAELILEANKKNQ